MFKRVTTFFLPEGKDPEAFWEHWSTEHAAKFKKLPGLKKYAVNRVTKVTAGEAKFWGMIETWFDSEEDAVKAFSSPEMKQTVADGSFAGITLNTVYVQEVVVIG